MSVFFKWDPSVLSVKVQAMDEEHIILIDKMNALHSAYSAKKPVEEITRLLNDFASYTVSHFADEEAYMDQIKFEGAEVHKIIHKQLLSQVTGYVESFKSTGELTDAFFNFLTVWLTSHIKGIDIKYGKP